MYMYRIYLDMDGVLDDFKGRCKEIGLSLNKRHLVDPGKSWKKINYLGEGFWKNIKWMEDGKKLVKFICSNVDDNIHILSSMSKTRGCHDGKLKWLSKNLKPIIGNKRCFALLVKDKGMKLKYATRNGNKCILIDDDPDNINDWNSKGGIGILHKSAEKTIGKLKKLLRL